MAEINTRTPADAMGPSADEAGLLFGTENPVEARINDLMVNGALAKLQQFGVIPAADAPDWARYRAGAAIIDEVFDVKVSSITTRMARLLFGITTAVKPRTIACIGSARGNALAWMALAAPDATVIGVDVDAPAMAVAAENFDRAHLRADWMVTDGRRLGQLITPGLDLVLLDADDPDTGKDILCDLLVAIGPSLSRPGVVLAHDACHAPFAGAFGRYRDTLTGALAARRSVTMPIDRYGLEVTAL